MKDELRKARAGLAVLPGNVELALSHVVPDLVQKVLKGQDPLHLLGDGSQVRHYTYGGDLARGIVTCMEHESALNEDFNISTATSTTVLEVAELIWRKVHGPGVPFRYVCDPPFTHDVQPFLVYDAVADFSAEHHRMAMDYAAGCCAVVLSTKEVLR